MPTIHRVTIVCKDWRVGSRSVRPCQSQSSIHPTRCRCASQCPHHTAVVSGHRLRSPRGHLHQPIQLSIHFLATRGNPLDDNSQIKYYICDPGTIVVSVSQSLGPLSSPSATLPMASTTRLSMGNSTSVWSSSSG